MMQRQSLLIKVLLTLVFCGVFASLFSGPIQTALTIPPIDGIDHAVASEPTATPEVTKPVPTRTPAIQPTKTASPVTQATPQDHDATDLHVFARDTFKRKNQNLWGKAADGQQWNGDANKLDAFSIEQGNGQIDALKYLTAFPKTVEMVLGTAEANANVVATGSLNRFADGVRFGVVIRWRDSKNWYRALLDGKRLVILRCVNGQVRELQATEFLAAGNTAYSLRVQAVGALLFARVWRENSTEPAQWQLIATDTSLKNGFVGLQMDLQFDTLIRMSSFQAESATLKSTD